MPNLLVAGNSTNGGTAISTDTSGTLNIVTGSGSGANAITIDASQAVVMPGTLAVTGNQTIGGNLTVTGTVTGSNTGGLGVGQTWQTVTGSRVAGTTYTNSTGKPILIAIQCSAAITLTITINGATAISFLGATGTYQTCTALVPSGSTYSQSGAFLYWYELR